MLVVRTYKDLKIRIACFISYWVHIEQHALSNHKMTLFHYIFIFRAYFRVSLGLLQSRSKVRGSLWWLFVSVFWVVFLLLLFVCCCCCIFLGGRGGFFFFAYQVNSFMSSQFCHKVWLEWSTNKPSLNCYTTLMRINQNVCSMHCSSVWNTWNTFSPENIVTSSCKPPQRTAVIIFCQFKISFL